MITTNSSEWADVFRRTLEVSGDNLAAAQRGEGSLDTQTSLGIERHRLERLLHAHKSGFDPREAQETVNMVLDKNVFELVGQGKETRINQKLLNPQGELESKTLALLCQQAKSQGRIDDLKQALWHWVLSDRSELFAGKGDLKPYDQFIQYEWSNESITVDAPKKRWFSREVIERDSGIKFSLEEAYKKLAGRVYSSKVLKSEFDSDEGCGARDMVIAANKARRIMENPQTLADLALKKLGETSFTETAAVLNELRLVNVKARSLLTSYTVKQHNEMMRKMNMYR